MKFQTNGDYVYLDQTSKEMNEINHFFFLLNHIHD